MGATKFKYQPACMLRLYVRLEDFKEAADPAAQREDKPLEEKRKAVTRRITAKENQIADTIASSPQDGTKLLDLYRDLRKLQELNRKLMSPTGAKATPDDPDLFSCQIITAPIDATVELNSPKIGDKSTVTLPFKDAPLVEQIVRAALLEVFMGTVPAESFSTPDKWKLPLDRSTIMFRGYVDQWETLHDGEKETVQLQARSIEASLRDAKIAPLASVYRIRGKNGEESIVDYVNRILMLFPATSGNFRGDGLRAVMYKGLPAPMLSRKLLNRALQTARSQNTGVQQGQYGVSAQDTTVGTTVGQEPGTGQPQLPMQSPQSGTMDVWELITVACRIVGLQPLYDPTLDPQFGAALEDGALGPQAPQAGDCIVLIPPETLFDKLGGGVKIKGGPRDGFARKFFDPAVGTSVPSDVRLFVWGKNIKDFKSSRKYGRNKIPAVEVISYNEDAPPKERVIRIRYPTTVRATTLNAAGGGKREEIVTRTVNGIRDPKLLMRIAVGLYSAIARQELTAHIKTDNLASYIDPSDPQSDNGNPDVLKLRPGTPVKVMVARQVQDPNNPGFVISSLSEIFERRTSELERFLREQNQRYRPQLDPLDSEIMIDLAYHRIATAIQSSRMTDVFYCRTVHHKFNWQEGWSADIEVMNYLEVRSLPDNLSPTDKALDDAMRTKEAAAAAKDLLKKFAERLAELLGVGNG